MPKKTNANQPRKSKSTKRPNPNKMEQKVFANNQITNRGISNVVKLQKSGTLGLSRCALRYALACAEPFHPKARGVCGVFGTSFGPSQKVSAVTRFTFVIGTAGLGFVAIAPCLANDGILAYATTASYATSTVQILTANNTLNTGVNTVSESQIPYTTAQLNTTSSSSNNPSLSGRLLAAGVRVTYVGTTMNQSGTYNCLAPSDHYNVSVIPGGTTPNTVASIQTDPQVVLEPCDRGWCDMAITPAFPYEMGYSSSSSVSGSSSVIYPYSNGSTYINTFNYSAASVNAGAPIAVIAVTGAQGGNVFQVELIQHIEYAGAIVGATASPSESDEQGGLKVLRAASQMAITKASTQKSGWALMYDLLKEAGTQAVQHIVPATIGAVAALL